MRRHVPALDGLRGLALAAVVLFHANGTLVGGYLGVDLFFVLSGFLITSLLVAEHHETGRVDFAGFWVRRARRLFPALISLLLAVAAYAKFLAQPEELRTIRWDALATLGYVANWRACFADKSYWEMFFTPSPLDHTWSLSIEEQFYVVWPVAALLFLRRGRRAFFWASAVLAALSMIAMLRFSDAEAATRAYMGTDTRAAAILAGALLALWATPDEWSRVSNVRLLDTLGAASALAIGIAWFTLEGESPFLYHGGFWMTEVCALPLLVCALSPQSFVGRALAFRPLVWLGTISYGAYLWHWPVDVVLNEGRTHMHGAPLYALQIAVTLVIAIASYRWLERPIRQRGVPFGKPLVVAAVALGVVLVALVSATRERPAIAQRAPDVAPVDVDGGKLFHLMVLGDSTANALGNALRLLREPGVLVDVRGDPGCAMLRDGCGSLSWAAWTRDAQPDATVIFLGGAFLKHSGAYRPTCTEWNEKFRDRMSHRLVGVATPTTRAWLVTIPRPVGAYDTTQLHDLVDCINASIRSIAREVAGIGVIDLAEHLCPKGECEREHAGTLIRPDGLHFDPKGGEEVARWLLAQTR